MMFRDYDMFRLTHSIPDDSIPVGSIGVVLMVFDGDSPAYEVEFPDGFGGNLGKYPTHTVSEAFMEALPTEKRPGQ
jgi:hypothetical protein